MIFEVFCGTGGVGKTSLSLARAIQLAETLETVILTIDPSERLKSFIETNNNKNLKIKIFNPELTFKNLLKNKNKESNRLLGIIMQKNSGMNELLAYIEIDQLISAGPQAFILDTPPSKHFSDFINIDKRVLRFYSNQMIRALSSSKKSILGSIIKKGVDTLLSSLKKLTGPNFVDEFLNTVEIILDLEEEFSTAKEIKKDYFNSKGSIFYLVTNAEHSKFKESEEIFSKELKNIKSNKFVIINKSSEGLIEIKKTFKQDEKNLLNSFTEKEDNLKKLISKKYRDYLIFPEILGHNKDYVLELSKNWDEYELYD